MTRAMHPARRAGLSEAHLEQQLLDLARIRGWKAHHVRDSRHVLMGDTGAPDWWLARHGRLVVVELKREDGKLSPDQAAFLAELGWENEQQQWAQELSATRLTVWVIRPSSFDRFMAVLE